jgi:hypothetical protein
MGMHNDLKGGGYNLHEDTGLSDWGKAQKKNERKKRKDTLLGWPITLERFDWEPPLENFTAPLQHQQPALCIPYKKTHILSQLGTGKRVLHSHPFPSLVNIELHKIQEHGTHEQALARFANNYHYMGAIATVHFLKQRRNSCQGT